MRANRVDRIFTILEHLASQPDGRLLTQIGKDLGFPLSSLHDLLKAMEQGDVITCDPARHYRLGPRIIRLGLLATDAIEVRRIASPFMRALAEDTGEDVYLALRIGDSIVYAYKYGGIQPVKLDVRLGEPRPLHSTSVGKLFLAFDSKLLDEFLRKGRFVPFTSHTITDRRALLRELDVIRTNGVSVSREETFEGVLAIASPVWDRTGAIAATISVSGIRPRFSRTRIGAIVRETRSAALSITRALGGRDQVHPSRASQKGKLARPLALARKPVSRARPHDRVPVSC